jgi:hypothetical protein
MAQAEAAKAEDFKQHLLNFPKGGQDEYFEPPYPDKPKL